MAVKIRLRQQGTTNRIMYRVVAQDSREPRDGKYFEILGWYNPKAKDEDNQIFLKEDRIQHWLNLGAVISESVESLMKKKAPVVMKEYQAKVRAKRQKIAQKRRKKKAA